MKTASIIAIGSELMKGKMNDTNSTFISKWLFDLGIMVKWRISIADEIQDIIDALKITENTDIIILTGGLGPTTDDCTREACSKYLEVEMELNNDIWESLKNFFLCKNISTPESNKTQAMIFKGAEVLNNEIGTAPGQFLKKNNKFYILLPGPPAENQLIIKNILSAKFYSNNLINGVIYNEVLRIYNSGESAVADLFKNISFNSNLGYYFSSRGWIELHITKTGMDQDKITQKVKNDLNTIKDLLIKNDIFFTENKKLAEILYDKLKQKELSISFGESITGGNMSGELVKIPGVSECLTGSVVTYSNQSKIQELGVSAKTLEQFGAVSKETANEMVIGLDKKFNTDIAVAVTGIAGPSGATDKKPLGLVHFGFKINKDIITKKEVFLGNRERIINKCINYAFIEILKRI